MRIIAGQYGGRILRAPSGRDTRPSSDRLREALMSILGARLDDARVLDAFAGTGALGLEALSRGASHCTFIEHDPKAMALIKRNADTLGIGGEAVFLCGDAVGLIPTLGAFDIAFLDPPYASDLCERALEALVRGHVAPGGVVVAETDKSRTISPPEGYHVYDTRVYAQARLHFIRGVS